jgi:hypothetical protein
MAPDTARIAEAVEYYTFANVTKRKFGQARKSGEEDPNSMQRKGISGDWVNHFDLAAMQMIDEALGDVIVELGYEKDRNWIAQRTAPAQDSSTASKPV